ncbi:MAG: tetratricopeptide repeat-containing sensor histidine kinase [Flavobacterium sp.]|uniref:tetratricopeptide repeat-containing sensor histidine kinase n=1 Tax=Flavobacterium sp. TaxID=239 RepID=UPI0032647E43
MNRQKDGIEYLKKSIKHATEQKNSQEIYINSIYNLADLYYTIQDFKESYNYAFKISTKINPTTSPNKYIILHSILGGCYADFKKYDNAIFEYQKAIDVANKYDSCLAIELFIKQAKRYGEKGNFEMAEKLISKGLNLAEHCSNFNLESKLNIIKSLIEISIRNKKTEKSINLINELYAIDGLIKQENRDQKLDSIETIYKTKIKEDQNKKLKKSNLEKEKDIRTQKIALLIVVFGLILLTTFLFYIFYISKKQKQTNKELERLHLLNQKIFSVISHDFRSPMLNLEVLLKVDSDIKNFEANKFKIQDDLKQANLVLENLLGWSKKELGMADRETEISNVYIETNAITNQLDYLLKTKKIQLINDVPQEKIIKISTDILKIILRNLISNAIKFSYQENNIIVGFNQDSNEYYVQDFGTGIEKSKVDSLLKGKSISSIGTNFESGFGLGLHFVSELLHQNGGEIRIESIENEGTIVFFKCNIN